MKHKLTTLPDCHRCCEQKDNAGAKHRDNSEALFESFWEKTIEVHDHASFRITIRSVSTLFRVPL